MSTPQEPGRRPLLVLVYDAETGASEPWLVIPDFSVDRATWNEVLSNARFGAHRLDPNSVEGEVARQLETILESIGIQQSPPGTFRAIDWARAQEQMADLPVATLAREALTSDHLGAAPDRHPNLRPELSRSRTRAAIALMLARTSTVDREAVVGTALSPVVPRDEAVWGPPPDDDAVAVALLTNLRRQQESREQFRQQTITRYETAKVLNTSLRMVSRYLREERILGIRVGREWRIPRWQFEVPDVSPALLRELALWFPGDLPALTAWVTPPSPEFDHDTPLSRLANQGDNVLVAALGLNSSGW